MAAKSNLCRMILPWMFPVNSAISSRNMSEGFPRTAGMSSRLHKTTAWLLLMLMDKSKRLQRTQNGYVSCKSNLHGAIHESLLQPQLSLPGVRQKVSLTQHVCPANCMLAAPNYCRNYMSENIKTLTWKTCRSLHAQSCAVQEEKARITVSSLVVSWVSILLHGCLHICAGWFCHECSLQTLLSLSGICRRDSLTRRICSAIYASDYILENI